jgi:flavorubredoxin
VAYASMYGNTKAMAEAVARGLTERGVDNVIVHDVARTHVSFVLRDIWRYKGLVLAAPTYNAKLFPAMEALVSAIENRKLKDRVVGIAGCYGWHSAAAGALREFAESCKLDVVEPVVDAKCAPNDENLSDCARLAAAMAERLKG